MTAVILSNLFQQLKLRHSVACTASYSYQICRTQSPTDLGWLSHFLLYTSPSLNFAKETHEVQRDPGLKLVTEFEMDNRSSDSVHPTKPLGIQRWGGKTHEIDLKLKFMKISIRNLPCSFFWGMDSVNIFPVCYWEENLLWFLLMFLLLLQCHELVRPQRWRLLLLRNFVSGCRQHNFLASMALGHRSNCAGPNSKYIAWIFCFPAY